MTIGDIILAVGLVVGAIAAAFNVFMMISVALARRKKTTVKPGACWKRID